MKYHIKHQLKSAFQDVINAQQELTKMNKILDDLIKKHCKPINCIGCELKDMEYKVKEWTDGYNSK